MPKEMQFISKIWKQGDQYMIGIPQKQIPLFRHLRGKSLLVTVKEIDDDEVLRKVQPTDRP